MMKKMPPAIREHALQIANHEMGHYVVAEPWDLKRVM